MDPEPGTMTEPDRIAAQMARKRAVLGGSALAGERTLLESEVDHDPLAQFQRWLQEAIEAGEPMPNAMALATADITGTPSVRMVLLDTANADGFTFETNRQSPKVRDLAGNPRGAATFFWPSLVRQVRVSGVVSELSRVESAAYFELMPDSLKAMLRACRQSDVIPDRATLEQSFSAALASGERQLPEHWGAYRLRPEWIEFFQSGRNWLQDRLRYSRTPRGEWRIQRLVP